MVFTDIIFLPFLICVFLCFFLARQSIRGQQLVLLISSLVFYAWWKVYYIWLIVFSSLFDFYLAQAIHDTADPRKKKRLLLLSLTANLGLLGYFKYTNFFIESIKASLQAMGISSSLHALDIVLPVGISFYTFEIMSYTLDVYRGHITPTRSALKFMVFVTTFPRLVAGPIVRAKDVLAQLDHSLYQRSNSAGLFLIVYGLLKKVLLADMLGSYVVDPVFSSSPHTYGALELVLAAYCYAFQIFFDFSAYSDIAIGLGKLFGLEFPVNFRFPYVAKNPSEFWRRWHISLSSWLRDYLYIPLGGNRAGPNRHVRNLMITMLLGGLWHGANWTFVIWGGLHGAYLVLYKYLPERGRLYDLVPSGVKVFLFFNLICLTWVFFRAPTVSFAFEYLSAIFSMGNLWTHKLAFGTVALPLLASVVVHYFVEPRLDEMSEVFDRLHWVAHAAVVYVILVVFSFMGELGVTQKAFIYFQF